jgi:hypothetical protein
MDLLQQWKKTISPAGEKYVFENNNGCQSLNAVLPAYFFFDFGEKHETPPNGFTREIISVPYTLLVIILQLMRLLVVGIFAWAL